jgi:predicted dehydrogenase
VIELKLYNEVRWGIIGCGDVTEVKSGPAFQKAENSKLVAVMRRNGNLAKDYALRHNVPKWYENADELINDPDVNAIYIATPPAFHKEYTLKAARAGKAVYVEKPMALNHRECLEMIETCERQTVPLFVAYYRRALPRFLRIKEILDSGTIGDIRFVTTTHYRPNEFNEKPLPWRVQPAISGGGLFFDLASHTIDILDFLLGPIKDVEGFTSNQGGYYAAEDIVTATYLFESGIHGMATWCFASFDYVDSNEIIGSKGKISFSTFGNDLQLTTESKIESWDIQPPEHIQQPLIQTIVNQLTTGKGICSSTGTTAAKTNWVMDQLVRNYYQ